MAGVDRRDQRGQILVIVAGGLIGLLAIAAFALEGGTIMLNRRDAQNSSDLAAVAGARIVALHYTDGGRTQADVFGAMTSNMSVNGCASPAPCTWTANFVGSGLAQLGAVTNSGASVPSGAVGVRAQVTRTPNAILGRMLGFTSWPISTEGTALSTKASSVATGTMLPIALCGWRNDLSNDCLQASNSPSNALDFQPGQIYDLTDGKDAPGGFGWLSWDGSNSANALSASVCTPNNPAFTLDSPFDSPGSPGTIGTGANGETWFPVDPGKSNKSSMRACLDQWIARGTTVLVPIYDFLQSTGGGGGNNSWYHITGVAAFVLTSRDQPAVDNIQGYFVEYVPFSGDPGGGSLPPDAGDTTVFIGLVK
jgi:Flp pilus assembly protein TadG